MDPLQKETCLAIVNIFESGSVKGNYGAVTVLKGDSGHLTYGRSQTTLGSGNLYPLLHAYCTAPDALHAADIQPYLDRVAAKDFTLDTDTTFKAILREAGQDPVMQREQDDFFERAFFDPSIAAAQAFKLQLPLSQTVVYDSHIQGGWGRISSQVIKAIGHVGPGVDEHAWIAKYVDLRADYLLNAAKPLPATVYRMEAFRALIAADQWDLPLPLVIHGVNITESSFGDTPTQAPVRVAVPDPEADSKPILKPSVPYTKGPDVVALQKLLSGAGFSNSANGVYGPFTQTLVKQFEQKNGLKADAVVSPQIWSLLQQSAA